MSVVDAMVPLVSLETLHVILLRGDLLKTIAPVVKVNATGGVAKRPRYLLGRA